MTSPLMHAGSAADGPLAIAEDLFRRLATARIQVLVECRKTIATEQAGPDVVKQVGDLAHKIAGTAETLGFGAIGTLSNDLYRITQSKDEKARLVPALDALLSAMKSVAVH
jgi:predicted membrane GTPase involved in stress response